MVLHDVPKADKTDLFTDYCILQRNIRQLYQLLYVFFVISYLLTYLLTPWCRVLLEKLTGL
jgi:hypothetical protein